MSKTLHVLIVEDNEDDLFLLLRALKQAGFDTRHRRVETAEDMRAALYAAVWDFIISDYNMPHFNALAALQLLRDTGKDIPFLIVSGTITEEMAVAGMRAGAHDYLMKDNLARLGPVVTRELTEAANRSRTREAERSLRASDEKFRATFDQAAVGIGHADFTGRWVLVNNKLCDILGYTAEELQHLTFMDITYPEDLPTCLAAVARLRSGEVPIYAAEKRYQRKDKMPVWVQITMSLARDMAGHPDYYIAVVEDVSERRQARMAIESLNARLAQAMTETHHRVKNNLQYIAAMVDMLDDTQEMVPVSELKRLGRTVRTLAMVHDLLTQQAKRDATADWFSVQEMLEELLTLLRATAPNRTLDYELDEIDLLSHQGGSLALIANELVSNALKYSRSAVRVTFVVQGKQAALRIADDGPGFSADFDPRTAANTGLELVENIARHDLRGTVQYAAAPTGGGLVTVTFPLPSLPAASHKGA